MADPKAPDTAEAFIDDLAFLLRMPVEEIRRPVLNLLKARSLHIVSEADRKVLEAMGNAHPRALKNPRTYGEDLIESCDAELARRSGT